MMIHTDNDLNIVISCQLIMCIFLLIVSTTSKGHLNMSRIAKDMRINIVYKYFLLRGLGN